MFSMARIRVLAFLMTPSRKSGKFFPPDVPASTIVVTPLRNEKASACTLASDRAVVARSAVPV